eukprot:evm.model.scf_453.7 EVM.evm.TU.scf_453.7   scf_453:60854-63248(+)
MVLTRCLWAAAALAAILAVRANGASAEDAGSHGPEALPIKGIENHPQRARKLLQFAQAGFNQQGNNAQAGTFSGQPGAFNGQTGAFNGQAGAFNGQAGAFNGQPGVFNGQGGAFSGQQGAFNGQAAAFNGQAGAFNGQSGAFTGQPGAFNGQAGAFNGQAGGFNGQAGAFPVQGGGFPGQPGFFPGFIAEPPAEPPTFLDFVQQTIQDIRDRPRPPVGERLTNLARGVGSVVGVVADVADIVGDFANK